MNEHDTADIVKRIVGTWPMAPKGFLWTEALAELDYATALATFALLRDQHDEQRISIARFKLTCAGIANRGSTDRRHDTEQDHAGPTMSFDEYLERLRWRGGTGDPEAIEMLDVWTDNERRGLIGSWLS